MAQVGIGETSARGSDRRLPESRPTHSPGKFAELVAKANPRLKFDAWSHHPYPSNPNSTPSPVVKWPNVSLASLPRFDDEPEEVVQAQVRADLDHRVRPPDQAAGHLRRLVREAGRVHPAVDRDRDEPPVRGDVHLVRLPGRPGPAVGVRPVHRRAVAPKGSSRARFAASARPLDARNGAYSFRAGRRPRSSTSTRGATASSDTTGTPIGMTWRIFRGGGSSRSASRPSPLRVDCTISARLRFRSRGEGPDLHRDLRAERQATVSFSAAA